MAGDRGKTRKEEFVGRLEKAKGRLHQSVPEIRQRVRTSSAVDIAQSIFRQFADDIQLKDLLAKAGALVANAERTFTKAGAKDAPPTAMFWDETPASESSRSAVARKTKAARLRKAAPKKTSSKKKKKPAPGRKAKKRA
jgi:hypothetical protein